MYVTFNLEIKIYFPSQRRDKNETQIFRIK